MEKDLVTRLSALGMTKQDLAQSLGVSLSSIYHWRELPKYVQAYLASRERESAGENTKCSMEREAWKDEVAKAAEARTDTPLADRMTCRVTQYGNLNWHIEPEKESGNRGLEVSVLPDSVESGSEKLHMPAQREGAAKGNDGRGSVRKDEAETVGRAKDQPAPSGRRRG